MKNKNRGYVLPVAVGVLVIASLGLLFFSWGKDEKRADKRDDKQTASTTTETQNKQLSATDEVSLDVDEAMINAQLKSMDSVDADINSSINDKSSI